VSLSYLDHGKDGTVHMAAPEAIRTAPVSFPPALATDK